MWFPSFCPFHFLWTMINIFDASKKISNQLLTYVQQFSTVAFENWYLLHSRRFPLMSIIIIKEKPSIHHVTIVCISHILLFSSKLMYAGGQTFDVMTPPSHERSDVWFLTLVLHYRRVTQQGLLPQLMILLLLQDIARQQSTRGSDNPAVFGSVLIMQHELVQY